MVKNLIAVNCGNATLHHINMDDRGHTAVEIEMTI